VLGTLAIIDVCEKEIPRGYFVFRISHREAAYLEPSVHSVGTPAAMLYFVDATLFDRLDASLDNQLNRCRENFPDLRTASFLANRFISKPTAAIATGSR
jgi:hypothetical protein